MTGAEDGVGEHCLMPSAQRWGVAWGSEGSGPRSRAPITAYTGWPSTYSTPTAQVCLSVP